MKKSFSLCLFLLITISTSLFSTTRNWNAGTNGAWGIASNWSPSGIPGSGDDVIINGNYTITVSSNRFAESLVLSGGADLVIALNKTLTVSGNNGDGVELIDIGTTLTVFGTLNSSNHTNGGDGVKVGVGSFIKVETAGKIIINNVSEDGFDLDDNVTNDGIITITDPGEIGINTGGEIDRYFVNNGSITISGGTVSIDGKGQNWFFTNNGTFSLSNASISLVDDGTNIDNFGMFKGNGIVENGNNYDVDFKIGSTAAPGTSSTTIGLLTFEDILDFTGVNVDIEIAGATSYDQILVELGLNGPADVTLSGAQLNLSGSYIPVGGEEFMILEKVHPGPIDGTFSGIPEGGMIEFNGALFTISYEGGSGNNDVTMTFDSPLPIELIDFSARAMDSEVKLEWITATETNNDFFTLERSIDGRTFEAITKITGNGNSTETSKYIYMDKNPENGLSYYRLKQTDFDGQFSYSDIEQVEFRGNETIKIYPTQVSEILNIETNTDSKNGRTAFVSDINGRVLKSFDISKNEHKKEIFLSELLPGNYFLNIQNGDIIQPYKFVKL